MGHLVGGGWIGALAPQTAAAVRARMREVVFRNAQTVFRQGDDGFELYEIIEGQVAISHVCFNGEVQIVTVFGPGDCFGEQSLVDGLPRANSAQARGHTRVRALGLKAFVAIRREYPDVTDALLRLISWRFRLALSMVSEKETSSLRQMLLRRIYGLAQHALARCDERIVIRVSQAELAAWVGFSRQRVNAALQSLQNDGLLALERGRIAVVDGPALETMYDADRLLPRHP